MLYIWKGEDFMKISTRDMVLVSLFTALTAIGAFLSIPLGNVLYHSKVYLLYFLTYISAKLGSLSQLSM